MTQFWFMNMSSSLLKPNGFVAFYIFNGTLDILLSLILYLTNLKKSYNVLFIHKNQNLWWWYNILGNRALAKILVTTSDNWWVAKFQVRLVLNGLPHKWHLLKKARILSDGTSICQTKLQRAAFGWKKFPGLRI